MDETTTNVTDITNALPQESEKPEESKKEVKKFVENAELNTAESSTLNIFTSGANLELAWKISNNLAKSSIVPKDYQNQPSNCLIALDMAARLDMSPIMVMQNLYIVYGRPSWSGQMVTALINKSRRFKSPLKFVVEGTGKDMTCYALAQDLEGNDVVGPTVTIQMAKDEGWYDKNGSKWKTMPEMMIRYRASSFFGRIHCPDIIMGLHTTDEIIEMSTGNTKPEIVDPLGKAGE